MRQFYDVPVISGFQYTPCFLSAAEEETLLTRIVHERFAPIAMRGRQTRRSIVSYGLEFRPHVGTLAPAPALPDYLHAIRTRAAAFVGISPGMFAQSLLTKYPKNSDIGWHIDHQSFGGIVVAISLLGDAMLALRRDEEEHRVMVAPRSLYVLRDSARFDYQHKLTARSLRYSITLRPIADTACAGIPPVRSSRRTR